MSDEFQGDVQVQGSADEDLTIQKEARSMGWSPREEFKGDPDRFVDAAEFVERGKHVMPILKQNNARLRDELASRDEKISRLESALNENNLSIKELKQYHAESLKNSIARAKQDVLAQLRAAREDGDVDAELSLTEKLSDLRQAERDTATVSEESPVNEVKTPPVEQHPEVLQFQRENPWFGQDTERTENFLRLGRVLRASNPNLSPKEFSDELLKMEALQNRVNPPSPKVSAASPNQSSRGGSKSYQALPSEAKRECDSFAAKVVGQNKVYKTLKDWQDQYAKDYYGVES